MVVELIGDRATASAEEVAYAATFQSAYTLFLGHSFRRAAGLFAKCLETRPDDLAAQQHLDKAREFMVNPPLPGWNGVRKMTEK